MPEKPVEQQPPEVLAMVLVDTVLWDVSDGRYFLKGTFSVIQATDFPWTHPAIVVYTAITNGHGKTPLRLRLIDVDETREPIEDRESLVEFEDPIVVVEPIFVLTQVVFPEPGEYRVQLYGAGQFLRERRLQVVPPPTPS
jgi:hypothetical protein